MPWKRTIGEQTAPPSVAESTPAPGRDAAKRESDPPGLLLEGGLCAIVLLAPLPFGSVVPAGRLLLELGAATLGVIWLVRALWVPTRLPPLPFSLGVCGLLLLGTLQLLPLGEAAVSVLSPEALRIRAESAPPPEALAAETRILGVEPATLDGPPALSVDPARTASALRTGCALAVLFFVGFTVATTRGATRLFLACLVAASFQGLYGLLVLASGHDRIWHVTKQFYLSSATGTFVNKNHFACFLAMTLACGAALILSRVSRTGVSGGRRRIVALFSNAGSRNLLLALLLVLGLSGLLASLSRAGIAFGVLALILTVLGAARFDRVRTRLVVALLVILVAAAPLLWIGSEQLLERFSRSTTDLTKAGSRLMVWGDTLSMAAAFPLTGAGFGTFVEAYPRFRSPEVRLFYTHAHNDLVQLASEAGLAGLLLLGTILLPLGATLVRALGAAKGVLGVGCAAGLLAVLLHALFDFNFHIPANAALAAILAGTLVGLPWTSRG